MRLFVLDTETTGLDWKTGDRLLEIAGVVIIDRKLTGRHYHVYVNPQRDIDAGAVAVHGITRDFLADKPLFKDVADGFSAFVAGSESTSPRTTAPSWPAFSAVCPDRAPGGARAASAPLRAMRSSGVFLRHRSWPW